MYKLYNINKEIYNNKYKYYVLFNLMKKLGTTKTITNVYIHLSNDTSNLIISSWLLMVQHCLFVQYCI